MSSREEFEAWYLKRFGECDTQSGWSMERWEAWQASRAALAIDLPKPLPSGDYRMTAPFYKAADIIEALSAAGIEVKA